MSKSLADALAASPPAAGGYSIATLKSEMSGCGVGDPTIANYVGIGGTSPSYGLADTRDFNARGCNLG